MQNRYYVVDAFKDSFMNGPYDDINDALRFIVDGDDVNDSNRHNLCIVQVIVGPSPLT